MRQFSDFAMSKSRYAVPIHRRLRVPVRGLRVLKSLPRIFMPGFVLLLSMPAGGTMRMRRQIVQFGRSLVVLVVRSVVIAS